MGLKFKFLHFKSFFEPAEINLAPITLIYGENSSGKSTIIECLRMIRQSGSSRINSRPRTNNSEDIDLGENPEIISKYRKNEKEPFPDLFNYTFTFSHKDRSWIDYHQNKGSTKRRSSKALENVIEKYENIDPKQFTDPINQEESNLIYEKAINELEIVKCFSLDDKYKYNFEYDFGHIVLNGYGLEFSLQKEIEKENIESDYEEFGDTLIEESKIINGYVSNTYGPQDEYDFDTYEDLKESDYDRSILSPLGPHHKIWYPLIKSVIKNYDSLVNAIETAKTMGSYNLPKKTFASQQRKIIPFQGISEGRLNDLLEEIYTLVNAQNAYIDECAQIGYSGDSLSLETIDPLIYYDYEFDKKCTRFCNFLFEDLMTSPESDTYKEKYDETGYYFKHLLKGGWYANYLSLETSLIEHLGKQLKTPIFDPCKYLFFADRLTLEIFKRFKFIPSLKKPATRDFSSTGSNKRLLKNDASNLAELLFNDKELLKNLNSWLKNSHFQCELKVNEIRRDIFEIVVYDLNHKNSHPINLKDSGSGLFNILPLITQSYLSKEPSFIVLEEPEVTLHPKLQIALADFINKMVEERENTYLIETHSEHLILNLLQLIKEGKLPHNWLNVYVTTKNNEGSHLHKMDINEKGEFTNPWPGGFFEDRENLLMK